MTPAHCSFLDDQNPCALRPARCGFHARRSHCKDDLSPPPENEAEDAFWERMFGGTRCARHGYAFVVVRERAHLEDECFPYRCLQIHPGKEIRP